MTAWSSFALTSIALCLCLEACSHGTGDIAEPGETNDELRSAGQRCGGSYGSCRSGYACDSDDDDTPGKCVRAEPGEKGGTCGGEDEVRCNRGLTCEVEAQRTSTGHVVMGMPIHRHPTGKCVPND